MPIGKLEGIVKDHVLDLYLCDVFSLFHKFLPGFFFAEVSDFAFGMLLFEHTVSISDIINETELLGLLTQYDISTEDLRVICLIKFSGAMGQHMLPERDKDLILH